MKIWALEPQNKLQNIRLWGKCWCKWGLYSLNFWNICIALQSNWAFSKMFCQQSQQKYQLPSKSLPKYPPKRFPQFPQAPQAPAPCLPPTRTHYVSSCSISGFGGCSSLVSHRFPSNYRRQPQPSSCLDVELAGCSSCCRGFGGCSWPAPVEDPKSHSQGPVWSQCHLSLFLPSPKLSLWDESLFPKNLAPPGLSSGLRSRRSKYWNKVCFSKPYRCAKIKLICLGTQNVLVFVDAPSLSSEKFPGIWIP